MTIKLCNCCRRMMQIDENRNKGLETINCVFSSISNWDQFEGLRTEELEKSNGKRCTTTNIKMTIYIS